MALNTTEQLLNASKEIIYYDESGNGNNRGVDETGSKYTMGNYHITRERASDTAYGKKLAGEYKTDESFAQHMFDNPDVEEKLLAEITSDTLKNNPFLYNIDLKTASVVMGTLHNRKTQDNLKKACNVYAKQTARGAENLNEFKAACLSQIDINKAEVPIDPKNRSLGTQSVFVRGLALKSVGMQEYALSDDPNATYQSVREAVSARDVSSEALAETIKTGSEYGRSNLIKKNMWGTLPSNLKPKEEQPIVDVPVTVLKGVMPPKPRPDRSPEEISGFPAEATFP